MLVRHFSILVAALSLGACAGATPSTLALKAPTPGAFERSLKEPVLIAYDDQSGRLEAWPLRGQPNERPRFISGRLGITMAGGMAGNGDVLSIASSTPSALVAYDLDTKATTTLTDPFGQPFDVAIDKNGTRYVLDTAGVTVYQAGSQRPYQLSCIMQYYSGSAIAVDNEGNVFVNGYGNGAYGLFEYLSGSSQCLKVPLREDEDHGIGIDPKTDDLILFTQIGCAGGKEGTMLVYSKPYGKNIVSRGRLRGNCPGLLRLDATSTRLLFADGPPEKNRTRGFRGCSSSCITQRSYPHLRKPAYYMGRNPAGFTTIPNVLPN